MVEIVIANCENNRAGEIGKQIGNDLGVLSAGIAASPTCGDVTAMTCKVYKAFFGKQTDDLHRIVH